MQKQLSGLDVSGVNRIRDGFTDTTGQYQAGMREMLQATGAFRVESVRAHSAVENFTTSLQKRDVTFKTATRNMRIMNDVLREQYALQNMQTMGWSQDARNRISADAIIPRAVPERLGSVKRSLADVANGTATFGQVARETGMRVGLMSEVVRSAGHNMVNLGKNTQWAGRQLMVGLGVPFAAFGVAAGMAAYQVDKELTRIVKVYDNTTTNIAAENAKLKADSMATAKEVARAYGMAADESLSITAAFAATGEQGVELQNLTKEVAAASLLGELDRQKAIDTTISLNTVFADSNYDVAESFRYMNALENATSLSMQDMTEAIPRLSGVIKGLGGDITDIGTLMAAARAAGENAHEAANTLKSMSFRNAVPTNKAREVFKQFTNVDLKELVDKTQGEVIPTIEALNAAMKDLSGYERIQVMRELQGLWKGSKANNIMNQFLGGGSEMVQRAREVAKGGADAWNETWDKELRLVQESASGKWQRAVASLKAELADVGEPFLQVATGVANTITKILSWFNELGEGKKKVLLYAAGFVALGTVLVMLGGVFMNLFGQITKTIGSIGMLTTRFRSTTLEQRVTELTAKGVTSAFTNQAQAASVLAFQLARVNEQLRNQAIAANAARLPAGIGATAAASSGPMMGPRRPSETIGGVFQGPNGTAKRPDYRVGATGMKAGDNLVAQSKGVAQQQALILDKQENINRASARAGTIWSGNRAVLMGTVGTMGLMAAGTNKWASGISMGLIGLAMLQPALVNATQKFLLMRKASKQAAFDAKVAAGTLALASNKAGAAGLLGRLKGIGGILPRLAPALGPFAIVAAGAAASFLLIRNHMNGIEKKAKNVSDSAKGWSEALNFEYQEHGGTGVNEQGAKITTLTEKINKFREANKDAYNDLNNFKGSASETTARAIEEGMKVALHGGSKEAAEEATLTAYQIMEDRWMSESEKRNFLIRIGVSFDDIDAVAARQAESAAAAFSAAAKNDVEIGWLESVLRIDRGDDGEMARGAKALVENTAREMWNAFDQTSEAERPEAFNRMKESMLSGVSDYFDAIRSTMTEEQRNLMNGQGVMNAEQFFNKWLSMKQAGNENDFFFDMGITGEAATRAKLALSTAEVGLKTLGQTAGGFSESDLEKINFFQLQKSAGAFPNAVSGLNATERAAAEAAEEIEAVASAADQLRGSIDGMALAAAKSAISNAMGQLADDAMQQVEDRHDAAMESLRKRGERAMDAIEADGKAQDKAFQARQKREDREWKDAQKEFERVWDERKTAVESSYDAQKAALEESVEAEREADRVRQEIFDRERMRIQRLADLYNQNIDFNVSLASGDLDEAARIGNNIRATTEGWAIDDAAAGVQTASEKRIAASEERIALIEEEKTAALEALEAEKDAAKEAAEAANELRKENLANEREMNREALEDRKKAEQEKQKAAEDSAEKSHEAMKRSLDKSLKAWRDYIPHNQEDIKAHTDKLQGIYNDHDIFLGEKGSKWGDTVAKAIKDSAEAAEVSLNNDINWALYGQQAAADFIQGAFGMDMNAFRQTFGIPGAATGPAGVSGTTVGGKHKIAGETGPGGYHEGGRVNRGVGAGTRTGYPMSAPRRPSEVDTRLKVGEYVVKDKAVRQIGVDNLNMINQGILPGYHEGGTVSPLAPGQPMGMPGIVASMMVGMMKAVLTGAMGKMGGGIGEGGQLEGGQFQTDGQWPPRRYWEVSPNTQAAANYIKGRWGLAGIGLLGNRANKSDHPWGKALDAMIPNYKSPAGIATGNAIAEHFVQNPNQFGTKYVIWRQMINSGSGWRRMEDRGSDTANHLDHPHISFRHEGGLIPEMRKEGIPPRGMPVPQLFRGGQVQFDNTLANLHRDETVLTAPLSSALERGIGNLDAGGNNEYHITMDFRGATVDSNFDVEGALEKAIQKRESRLGRNRKVK